MWMSYYYCFPTLIKKIKLRDYDLSQLSLETVQMFKNDSDASKYVIN